MGRDRKSTAWAQATSFLESWHPKQCEAVGSTCSSSPSEEPGAVHSADQYVLPHHTPPITSTISVPQGQTVGARAG